LLVADEIEIAPSAAAATVPVWNGFAAIPYLVLKPIFG